MLPRKAVEARRRHPFAWGSLLLLMLATMASGVAAIGVLLRDRWPDPTLPQIAFGAGAMIVAVPVLMFAAAALWLALARPIVARPVARAFFVHRGLGWLSAISETLFVLAYGRDDD